METIETAVSATNTGAEMIAMNAPNAADKQQQSNDEDEDEDEETAAAIVRPSVSIDESEIIVTDGRDDNETAMMMHHQEMLNGSDIITVSFYIVVSLVLGRRHFFGRPKLYKCPYRKLASELE